MYGVLLGLSQKELSGSVQGNCFSKESVMMNLKEKLKRDYPQLSEFEIDEIIKDSERKVDQDDNQRKG